DHADGLFGSGDDEIEQRFTPLVEGRVNQVLAVDKPDPHARDRVIERNVRQVQSTRRTGYGDNVRVVFGVRRDYRRDDLRFKAVTVGEQRPDRAVDHTTRQNFLLARPAFATEIVARNTPGGIHRLAVFNRER